MVKKRIRASGLETVQTVTATQQWKERMQAARDRIPEGIGQQIIIERVIHILPAIDSLRYKTRWHNAWLMKAADPEITMAIERVVEALIDEANNQRQRLGRKRLKPPPGG